MENKNLKKKNTSKYSTRINQILKKVKKTELKKLTRLDGYSNSVFFALDSKDNKFVFKFHSKEKKNPFKILENHVLKLINFKYIFEEGNLTMEKFIENRTFSHEEMFLEKNLILALFPIAVNKKKEIESKNPNLFFIFEKNKNKIFTKISQNIEIIKKSSKKKEIISQFSKINKIMQFYNQSLKTRKMVLSHNDLIYKNILFKKKKKNFFLIDFEYSGYNPKGMDIFSLLNEHLIDYYCKDVPDRHVLFKKFPSDDLLKKLIKFYLFFFKFGHLYLEKEQNQAFLKEIQQDEKFKEIENFEINEIFEEFNFFGIITNLFWYYWALYFFDNEDIEFNYVRFSECKFDCVCFFLERDGRFKNQ